MTDSKYGRTMLLAIVAGLFYVGSGLRNDTMLEIPSLTKSVEAGVAVANDEIETVFTSSEDGKTIYMWQYYSSKPAEVSGKRRGSKGSIEHFRGLLPMSEEFRWSFTAC